MDSEVKQADCHGNMQRLEEVLTYWAQRQPHRKAYTELDTQGAEVEVITYGELDRRSRELAAAVQAASPPGQHVMLAFPAGIDFVVAFFACMRAGLVAAAIPLPRDNRPNARLAQMVRASEAHLVLTTPSLQSWLETVLRREADWPQDIGFLSAGAGSGLTPTSLAAGSSELAFTQFTSGSTSLPKGVMVSHRAALYNLEMIRSCSGAGPESVLVSWLPHYHDLGLVAHILHSVYCGSHCVLMSPAAFVSQPLQWLRAISRYRGEYTGAPNFAYQLCVDRIPREEREQLDLSSLKMAINAAEPINPQTVKDFCAAFEVAGFRPENFLPAYGMAEATVFVSANPVGSPLNFKRVDPALLYNSGLVREPAEGAPFRELVGCGRSWLEQRVRVVDPKRHVELPPNTVGEFWLQGDNVMDGYYRNPEATQQATGRLEGDTVDHLRTGDLGFFDESGQLYITGRVKDVIIINGANYYPQDIEEHAQVAHPALRKGGMAAIGITQGPSEALVLFAELERQALSQVQANPGLLNDIAGKVCEAVGQHFDLPVTRIVYLKPGQLPKTSSGKIQRQECKRRYLKDATDALALWPLADTTSDERKKQMSNIEKALARITELGPDHLRVFSLLTQLMSSKYGVQLSDFDIEKSIFFYGIDSLNIIDIHAHLEKKLGCSIPTVAFFRANNFMEMIDDIVAAMADRHQFDRKIAEGATLREEIDHAVAQLTTKLEAVSGSSDGSIGRRTLLTGASGFVGVALLKEILERTDADVVCMVRAADETAALKRIRNTSAKYDLRLPSGFERRVQIMIGDMSKPRLGLSDADYQRFAREIDSVYHCAAIDNFYLPYSVMRKTNVLGTLEVLNFALSEKLKPIFYISSCAVSMLEGQEENTEVVGLVNGYAQSKFVAEQTVLALAAKGYPVINYRLGYLYNLRVQDVPANGSFDKLLAAVEKAYSQVNDDLIVDADAFENFLSSLPQIGACPDIDVDFDLTPVEYAAKAIVETTKLPLGERKTTYTFYNPQPLKWRDVQSYFKKAHPKVQHVPLPDFLQRYEDYIRDVKKPSAKLLKSVVSHQLQHQFNTMFRNVEIDHALQFKHWCPPCDTRFTHHYVDFAVNG